MPRKHNTEPAATEPKAPKAAKAKKAAGDVNVYSPNRDYNGTTAGVVFVNGNGVIKADTPNKHHLLGWFLDHGYKTDDAPAPEQNAPADTDADKAEGDQGDDQGQADADGQTDDQAE